MPIRNHQAVPRAAANCQSTPRSPTQSPIMSQSVSDSPPPTKSEKKHKKDKKRSREEAEEVPAVEDAPKKHKKSKSESLETETTEKKSKKSKKSKKDDEDVEEEAPAKKEKKKSKKSKVEAEPESEEEEEQEEEAAVASESEAEEKKKRKSKDKKEKKDKKDKKKRQASATPEPEQTTDAMDVDTTTSFPTDDADFPFYTQVHSLYVPFYPCGFDKPITNVAAQHLEPLLNHYSPVLRGVLLRYTNLNLSERPVQASVINPPTDKTPALLRSVDEYAVGFAYLTFDAHMFKPARGKWMEGVVQLQSEGHIGVQCWGRFNASIEAKRLPKGWKWVDLKGDNKSYNQQEEVEQEQEEKEQGEEEEEDQLDGEELQVVEQVHTTGYWVDASGKKVSGKVRFRIKNFDVGLAGDYGYLSLEGTFLNDEDERALQKEERELERKRRSRQNPGGLLRPMSRRVPEFSMTKFGKEEEEEDAGQRTVFAKVTGKEGDVTPDD